MAAAQLNSYFHLILKYLLYLILTADEKMCYLSEWQENVLSFCMTRKCVIFVNGKKMCYLSKWQENVFIFLNDKKMCYLSEWQENVLSF